MYVNKQQPSLFTVTYTERTTNSRMEHDQRACLEEAANVNTQNLQEGKLTHITLKQLQYITREP